MLHNVKAVLNDDQGQGLAEYALILSLVSIASIAMLGVLGTKIGTVLTAVSNAI